MVRFATPTAVATMLTLIVSSPVRAGIETYLTLSESSTSAWQNTGTPLVGEKTLYLWLLGVDPEELELGLRGDLEVVDLVPRAGYTNVGTAASPILRASTGCVLEGWVATVTVRDAAGSGGHICPDFSVQNHRSCWQECGGGEWWQFSLQSGYRTDGSWACGVWDNNCRPLSVGGAGWGHVKAMYR